MHIAFSSFFFRILPKKSVTFNSDLIFASHQNVSLWLGIKLHHRECRGLFFGIICQDSPILINADQNWGIVSIVTSFEYDDSLKSCLGIPSNLIVEFVSQHCRNGNLADYWSIKL